MSLFFSFFFFRFCRGDLGGHCRSGLFLYTPPWGGGGSSEYTLTLASGLFCQVYQRFEDGLAAEDGPYTKFLLPDASGSDTAPQTSPPNLTHLVRRL